MINSSVSYYYTTMSYSSIDYRKHSRSGSGDFVCSEGYPTESWGLINEYCISQGMIKPVKQELIGLDLPVRWVLYYRGP